MEARKKTKTLEYNKVFTTCDICVVSYIKKSKLTLFY